MGLALKPGAFLRRGLEGVPAQTTKFLIEHKEEVQAVHDALDARRDAALEAIAALEAKLAATEAKEAAMAADRVRREADLADRIVDLEAREKAVARGKKAMDDLIAGLEANPLHPQED